MKPIRFQEANTTFAKNQPEYLPLPAYKGKNGLVVSCWQLNWKERFRIFVSGRMWLSVLTFNKPLQPQRLDVIKPDGLA